MKRKKKYERRVVPQRGGEAFHEGEPGPLIYTFPMPPVKSRGRLVAGSNVEFVGAGPQVSPGDVLVERAHQTTPDTRPLVPASEEVAKLPRGAREAFAVRCAARVARLRPDATSPEAAAALVLAAATVDTPIRRQLLCIRRDFDRLVLLARKHAWNDDTQVPPEVFGTMWPNNLTPDWAQEPEPPAHPE
jgi:hypothetical protein